MVPYPELSDAEGRAILAYLRTVPPIKDAVFRPDVIQPVGADAGRGAYHRCGGNGRHGDSGVGLYYLRKGRRTSPPTTS